MLIQLLIQPRKIFIYKESFSLQLLLNLHNSALGFVAAEFNNNCPLTLSIGLADSVGLINFDLLDRDFQVVLAEIENSFNAVLLHWGLISAITGILS